MLYNFIYMKCSEQVSAETADWWLPKARVRGRTGWEIQQSSFEVMKVVSS
jgi:hypothetical protein